MMTPYRLRSLVRRDAPLWKAYRVGLRVGARGDRVLVRSAEGVALVDVVSRPGYPRFMSDARDELRELVEQLPDDEVPVVLAEVRRHVVPVTTRPWPPAFFGAGEASRSDVAERAEEILGEGFGRPA